MIWLIILLSIIGLYGVYSMAESLDNNNLFYDYVAVMSKLRIALLCTMFSIIGLTVVSMVSLWEYGIGFQ